MAGSVLDALQTTDAARWTRGYYGLFLCLGLSTALLGPTLPALAEQTAAPLGHMGWLFMAGAIGYTVGTTAGGWVFDRVRGHPVLGMAQLAAAVLLLLLPCLPWFGLVLGVLVCKGCADGVVNTGANTLLVWTHRDHVGPYLTGLHGVFGVGALLAPLLVAQVSGVAGGYRWAYWLIAACAMLVSLRLFTLVGQPRPAPHDATGPSPPRETYRSAPLVVAAALFLFFYVGAEVAFGGWVYTYAVALELANATAAAYLTSGFWLAFTCGRVLAIPLATRVPPQQIIPVALGTCLALLALVIICSDSRVVLWIATCGVGFSMAPLWPMGFTLAGRLLPLTASVSGMILLGDSCGGMVLPWLAGRVMGSTSPRALVYLVGGSLVGNGMAFVVMLRMRPAVLKRMGERRAS